MYEIIGFVVLGAALGLGLYQFVVVRLLAAKQRRVDIAWQLANAQLRHEQRRIAAGPAFPRAAMHVARISERAAHALRTVEGAHWTDPIAKETCIRDMHDLLRHCEELTAAMKPGRRRGDLDILWKPPWE